MAKTYTLSAATACEHVPVHPERTAYRNGVGLLNFDLTFKEWPSRGAMLTAIQMQGRRAPSATDWRDWYTSRYNRAAIAQAKGDAND